ncbi:short-chain dehydrogenase/reductase SDR [Punctularia strigosozonata HHB-11173 SS5]|uniref:short-chain dehydrogenase/reductase SDR n=1 Tax=Punctularia strigosozonata (strain HHB-11173) TaxID=741275 RepID=UPI00044175F6|nr:short-chain dehydrogenase/reductase SDR [Punctularia strigosozonata HHB-11173 SS5]EIN09669.1 short-chain dehydrogenase/reductase SDR [Punctularia strigosozonata HHB-11173 SS5]
MFLAQDKLRGKRIVVLGGTSGIGFAVARLVLYAGASVIVSSSNQGRVDAAVKRLLDLGTGQPVEGRVCDIKSGENAVKAFFEALPEFDHLVYTAGDSGIPLGYPDVDLTNISDAFAVRTMGPIYAGKYAPARMPKTASSSITFTSGVASRKPPKGWALPAAIIGATERFTKGLAVQVAPIRANIVSPGLVITELLDKQPAEQMNAIIAHQTKALPVQHVADADERCAYVTGELLNVDGGAVLV